MIVRLAALLVVPALAGACGGAQPAAAIDANRTDLPPAVCTAGTRYAPGTVSFRDVTGERGLGGVRGQRFNVVDFDRDGYPDLLARRGTTGVEDFSTPDGRHTWLLRNRGDGSFEDVTLSSGLLALRAGGPGGRPVAVAAFGDVDNDGDLDAYTGTITSSAATSGGETSEVMLNDGAGRFTFGAESSAI